MYTLLFVAEMRERGGLFHNRRGLLVLMMSIVASVGFGTDSRFFILILLTFFCLFSTSFENKESAYDELLGWSKGLRNTDDELFIESQKSYMDYG